MNFLEVMKFEELFTEVSLSKHKIYKLYENNPKEVLTEWWKKVTGLLLQKEFINNLDMYIKEKDSCLEKMFNREYPLIIEISVVKRK
jgi:hypothetical protein